MLTSIDYIEDGGIIIRVEGLISGNEIKKANDIIYESPDKIKKIKYQICDLTIASDFSASESDIRAISNQDKKASEINPNMLIAVVGEKDVIFGLARMWEAFSYDSPF